MIAQQLFDEGFEGEELFAQIWRWHDETGLETWDIFRHYKAITGTP